MTTTTTKTTKRRRVVIERWFDGSLDDVWALWTTKDGLESWWGPDGFRVEVRALDLRPGGELRYAMIADSPEMVAFMKREKMPAVQELSIRYVDVVVNERLRYMNRADFIPGVAAYDVETLVELHEAKSGVRLVLDFEAMHDDMWTNRAAAGWENELGRMDKALQGARSR